MPVYKITTIIWQSLGMPPRKGAKARQKFAKKAPVPPEPPADGYEGPYYGLYQINCAGQTYQGYWPCTRLEDERREGKFTGRLQVLCNSDNLIWWVSSG